MSKKVEQNRGEWKSNARNGHYRCTICNKTSGSFFKDPSGTGHLCYSCMAEIQELKTDYRISDEIDEIEKLRKEEKERHERRHRLHKKELPTVQSGEEVFDIEGSTIP